MAQAPAPKFIGAPIKRRDDPRLIQGLAHYVDDFSPPGTLHMAVARSPYGHAAIRSVDVSKAKAAEGVVAVYTHEDTKAIGPVPVGGLVPDAKVPEQPALADRKALFAGEPVAVVIARTRYGARDAADLVEVDYEPLDAVVDIERALEADAPKVHEAYESNEAFKWGISGGDVEAASKRPTSS